MKHVFRKIITVATFCALVFSFNYEFIHHHKPETSCNHCSDSCGVRADFHGIYINSYEECSVCNSIKLLSKEINTQNFIFFQFNNYYSTFSFLLDKTIYCFIPNSKSRSPPILLIHI